jgi:hypothetical protein
VGFNFKDVSYGSPGSSPPSKVMTRNAHLQSDQESKASQYAPPDIGGQFEFEGVPDRTPRRVGLVFPVGRTNKRQKQFALECYRE